MPQRHGKPWVPEEERELLEAFERGSTIEEIAQKLDRSPRAIQIRLEIYGYTSTSEGKAAPAQRHAQPVQPTRSLPPPIGNAVDGLINALSALKRAPAEGRPFHRAVANVTRAYERFNTDLLALTSATQPNVDESDQDPAPDRLRTALANAVTACVSNLKNRHVATHALGFCEALQLYAAASSLKEC